MDVNTNSTSTPDSQNMYNYMNGILMNPSVFIILALVVIVYIIIFLSLGNSAQTGASFYPDATPGSSVTSGSSTNMIIIIVIGVLIVLVLFNGFQYFFGVDIMASLSNLFSGEPQINIVVDQNQAAAPSVVPEIKYVEQVFNIPGNEYGYEDAKTLCSAYGSRLATYDEVEKAYDRGAEWCNYGWSANQLALFPTQKQTYDHLQTIDGHQNDCGRTGVNGGYIANPKIKFGVNCYGYKPKITSEEDELMKTSSPYPETMKDIAFQKRIDYWKNQVSDILVSPFNHTSWAAL